VFGRALGAIGMSVGIVANTIVKVGISVAVGTKRYRLIAAGVLAAMAAAIGVALVLI
jgi:hypothetical protein